VIVEFLVSPLGFSRPSSILLIWSAPCLLSILFTVRNFLNSSLSFTDALLSTKFSLEFGELGFSFLEPRSKSANSLFIRFSESAFGSFPGCYRLNWSGLIFWALGFWISAKGSILYCFRSATNVGVSLKNLTSSGNTCGNFS
jgi:hypothetical protein